MQAVQDRFTLGPLQNPVRGLLHGSAALVSAGLAAHLAGHATCDAATRLALVVFAVSQAGLYAASALYHSAPWDPRWKARMQRVDHSMIYLKIAGSITPVLWLGLEGRSDARAALLVAAWAVALLGIAQKAWLPHVHPKACVPVQVAQAALVLPALGPFAARFPGTPTALLAFSATIYVVGVAIFLTERPRLWPRIFSHHEVFHVITVLSSGAHYALALQYLARL